MNQERTSEQEQLGLTVGGLEFLRGVADAHLCQLAKLAKFVDFPKGTIIFSEGQPAVHCYLIVDGSVALEMCGPGGCTQILTVGEGELLGWSSVLGASQLTATATAVTATRAIELNSRELMTLCEQNPDCGYQLMRCTAIALAKRLTATRLQLLDLYGSDVPPIGECN